MTTRLKLSILMAVIIASGAAAILLFHQRPASVLSAIVFAFGSVALTNYKYPVTGTVAPTVAQASQAVALTAQVTLVDADTGAVITHNWQLANAALQLPLPSLTFQVFGTAAPNLTVTRTDSSTVTIAKAGTAGTGCAVEVTLQRPHTIIMPGV